MGTAEFAFEVDAQRSLVKIRMAGFFEREDVLAFLDARRKAHAQLRCPPNTHLTLNDLRDLKIQTQETVTAFRGMLAAPEYRSRKLAFVVGPSLTRGQLQRALGTRDARCFDDPEAAEAWLLGEDQEPLRKAG